MERAATLSAGRSRTETTATSTEWLPSARRVAATTWSLVRADAPLYLAIVLYTLCGVLLLNGTGTFDQATYSIYLQPWATNFLVAMPAATLIYEVAVVIHRFDGRRTLAFKRRFTSQRIAHFLSGVALLMAFMLFQGTFTSLKNALPVWEGGFWADEVLANADAWLHFGRDPWRYLYAVGELDWVRWAIEVNYNVLWFLICFGALFFVATSPRATAIRTRYMLSFMLVWIVCGNLLAGLLLSAGPAFYGATTGDAARFADQLTFIAGGAGGFSSAADYQHYLWLLYETARSGFGSGISAFPSVHVGLITMNAFFVAEYSRRWGVAAFVYVALIVASSVYLAWHYAIDGYASIAVVAAIHVSLRKLLPNDRYYTRKRKADDPGDGLREIKHALKAS